MATIPGPRYCSSCGVPLSPSARFCDRCGAQVPGWPYAPTQPLPSDAGTQMFAGSLPTAQDLAHRAPPDYSPLPTDHQPVYPGPPVNVHTTVALQAFMPPPSVIVVDHTPSGPNILVRLIWFWFIGLWLGSIVTVLGYALCLTILFLPVGLMLLNRLPAIMTLRPPVTSSQVTTTGYATVVNLGMRAEQRSFLARALYFLLVGWWAGGLWLSLAWLLVAIWPFTLGISLAPAFLMFDRLPAVMTLRRT